MLRRINFFLNVELITYVLCTDGEACLKGKQNINVDRRIHTTVLHSEPKISRADLRGHNEPVAPSR